MGSSKESAQLFYAMDSDDSGALTLTEFVGAIERGVLENPLKEWASDTFLRISEDIARQAVTEHFRRHACTTDDHLGKELLDYEGFVALLAALDPNLSQSELSRLWVIMDKQSETLQGPAGVSLEVFLRHMGIPPLLE